MYLEQWCAHSTFFYPNLLIFCPITFKKLNIRFIADPTHQNWKIRLRHNLDIIPHEQMQVSDLLFFSFCDGH